MKKIPLLKWMMGNLCIICSVAMLVLQVLDWYNPFMDVIGHSGLLLDALCICALVTGVGNVMERTREDQKKQLRR